MKNLCKRGLAVLLAFVMCVGMLSLNAFAADDKKVPTDTCNGNHTWQPSGYCLYCGAKNGGETYQKPGSEDNCPHTALDADGKCLSCGTQVLTQDDVKPEGSDKDNNGDSKVEDNNEVSGEGEGAQPEKCPECGGENGKHVNLCSQCTHPNTSKVKYGNGIHTVVCADCGSFWQESCTFVPTSVTGIGQCECGAQGLINTHEHTFAYHPNKDGTHMVTQTCQCGEFIPTHSESCKLDLVRTDEVTGAKWYKCGLCGYTKLEGTPRECEDSPDGKHSFSPKTGESGESWDECGYCHAVRNYKNDNLPLDSTCKHSDYGTYEQEIVHATHKQAGRMYVCCKKCNSVLSIKICPPLNGDCTGKLIDKKDPSCGPEDYGYEYYECTDPKCGEKWTVKLDPISHNYEGQEWQDKDDSVHIKMCTRDNTHEVLTGEHRYDDANWAVTKDDSNLEENFCLDCHHRITRPVDTDPEPTPTPDTDPEPTPTPEQTQPVDEETETENNEVDVDDPNVPLDENPVEIDDPEVPLAEKPEEPEKLEEMELEDPDTPLADVPQTGDNSHTWGILAALSGIGLMWLALLDRKNKDKAL